MYFNFILSEYPLTCLRLFLNILGLCSLRFFCNLKAFGRESRVSNVFEHPCRAKGQLISKCPFGVFKSPKKPTNIFSGFLSQPLEVKSKKQCKRARCWVAAHMCVISHFRTCDVRAEVRAERVWKCACGSACVWAIL